MRIGFVTCVQLGVDVLKEIHEIGGSVDAIITLHDDLASSKSGRATLDAMAERHGADLHKTRSINDPSTIAWLGKQRLDWLFIIGWSQIAREQVLASARYGVLGMHPTLLPEGRGRASIPWAILKGLKRSGVTLFRLDSGVDTGPIGGHVEIPIADSETASSLYMKAAEGHRRLIRENWSRIVDGNLRLVSQDEGQATVWPGRRPEDGKISSSMTVAETDRLVRAVTVPYPGARWIDGRGDTWVIWAGNPQTESEPGLLIPLVDGHFLARVYERV